MNAEHLLRKQPHLKLWLSRIVSNPKLVNNPYYQNVEKALVRWKSKLYEKKPPWQVHIENTNYCNARCVMCPNPTMEREKAFMTDQVYEKAIDDVVDLGIHRINLQSIGEPLLDKKFVDRLRLAKKFGLEVATSSNGSTLTERISQELVEARLDELNVSIDGYKSKTFNDIRLGLDYEQVVDNLERFLRIKKRLRSRRPLVFLRLTLMEENLEDTENFIQLWTRKVDGAFVSMAHDWAGGVPSRFRGHFHNLEAKIPPCKLLWQEIMILHDGTVSSCCHDFEGTNLLGNIMQQSLRTIWSGGAMRKIRGAHLDNRLDLYPTCDKCRIRTIWWV